MPTSQERELVRETHYGHAFEARELMLTDHPVAGGSQLYAEHDRCRCNARTTQSGRFISDAVDTLGAGRMPSVPGRDRFLWCSWCMR
jgi:hypothetical protein